MAFAVENTESRIMRHVQFHLELDDDLTIIEAHDISEEVEESS